MFTLANGDYVDLYSNGDIQATQEGAVPVTLPPYGVVMVTSLGPDYTSAQSLAFATPEPSTWVMMLAGFAGVGYAGFRASRRTPAAYSFHEPSCRRPLGDRRRLENQTDAVGDRAYRARGDIAVVWAG